jgi:hypothetical protein
MTSEIAEYGEKLENCVASGFYKYGVLVGRHPKIFLICPIILFFLCLPGLFFLKINLDLYKLFVPVGAPVRYEFERQHDYDRIPLGDLNAAPPPPPLVPLAKHKRQIDDLNEKNVEERDLGQPAKKRGRKNFFLNFGAIIDQGGHPRVKIEFFSIFSNF